ncbi:MAG TPA: hypothetical protein VK158_05660, partial [Acidobacteriota bacterium]|nr:hypothetical protein [Acidobacteriota bacterium]
MEFSTIVSLFENLEKTTKRGEKTLAISKILSDLQTDEIEPFFLLLQGRVFAEHDQQNLGISTQYIIKALERVSGYSKDEIVKKWSKVGDIGTVTVDILSLKKQSTLFEKTISLTKMMSQLRKLPTITGNGAIEQKTQIICDLLTSVDAKEAKYLVRIILEVMRVGIGEGIMRDAIVWAYFPRLDALSTIQDNKIIYSTAFDAGIEETADILKYRNILDSLQTKTITQFEEATLLSDLHCDVILTQSNYELCRKIYQYWTDSIQHAIDITNDIATIAKVTSLKDFAAIKQLKPVYGKPLKAMLAKKAVDIADGMQTVGMPCAIEYKYDGFRMQIHKNENKVTLFTRKLEEVTIQFPDVIASVLAQVKMERCIL